MSNNTNVPVAPVFDLGRVQYAFPAPLVSFVVCSDMLAMAFTSNLIVLIELSRADQVIRIPIPSKPNEMSIYKLFMDPSGRHIIVTSTQGDNWYLYRTWKKPRQLKSFKMVIESVAWNKAALLSSVHSTSTREILLGTRNGMIYEAVLDAEEDFFKSQERYLQPVYSLPERHPISGVRFDHYPPIDPRKSLVIVTTPSRIYQFSGPVDRKLDDRGRVFTPLFASYRDSVPSKDHIAKLTPTALTIPILQRFQNYREILIILNSSFTPQTQIKPYPFLNDWRGWQVCNISSAYSRRYNMIFRPRNLPWRFEYWIGFGRSYRWGRTATIPPYSQQRYARSPHIYEFDRVPFHTPLQRSHRRYLQPQRQSSIRGAFADCKHGYSLYA